MIPMSEMTYRTITYCRSCRSPNLEPVLDLGELCVSDFILEGENETRAPLELVVCQHCSLVQLRHTVDRDQLYAHYYYRSGVNESMVDALRDVVDDALKRVELQPDDYVLDIGCNDGTMLAMYPRHVWAQGFEPAQNLVHEAMKKAHARIFPTYFPPPWPMLDKYKIITSIAQFYNTDDPDRYVRAIKKILHPDGLWIVQFQDLEGMIACNGFDNVCHEHVTYWSRFAFSDLLQRYDLAIEDVSYNSTNGSSIRYVVRHGNNPAKQAFQKPGMRFFGSHAERLKAETVALLQRIKDENKTVIGVAASTKANTLLQYYGIGPELLPAIAERSTEKVGRLTVGTHIPIIHENELWQRKPDYLLALAWHFFDVFRCRYIDLEEAGARWIVPLPELRVIGGEECPSTKGIVLSQQQVTAQSL